MCLSVHPSVTCLYCVKMARRRIMKTIPHDSQQTLVFWVMPKVSAKFEWGHPQCGRQMQLRSVKIGIFWQITHHNSKIVQDRCTVSTKVKLWYCWWPWVTSNPYITYTNFYNLSCLSYLCSLGTETSNLVCRLFIASLNRPRIQASIFGACPKPG